MSIPLPAGACDSHVHVFGPATRYPFAADRVYTPGDASEAELDALHARLGIGRVVLVQPSVYGTDNSRLLAGLAALGPRARAVAVIDMASADRDLERLHAAGVRGVRLNLATVGQDDPEAAWRLIAAQAARVRDLGWHVQVLTRLPVVHALRHRIPSLPVPLVVDHFGLPDPAAGLRQPGFATLVDLLRESLLHVKLSAMRRVTRGDDLTPLAPFIAALGTAPGRLVWGSDWPHVGGGPTLGSSHSGGIADIEPFVPADDAAALALLARTVGNDGALVQVLVDTPARLYDFPTGVAP
jgi:predicted TIM-barrel fold metal-dependent hydrolase